MKEHLRNVCRCIVYDFPRANSCIYFSKKVTKKSMGNTSVQIILFDAKIFDLIHAGYLKTAYATFP